MTKKRISLKLSIVIPIVLLAAILIARLGGITIKQSRETARLLTIETARVTALYAANSVDINALQSLDIGEEESEEYKKVHKQLQDVITSSNMLFAYTMYTDGKTAYSGVVVGYDEKYGAPINVDYNFIKGVFNGQTVVNNKVNYPPLTSLTRA